MSEFNQSAVESEYKQVQARLELTRKEVHKTRRYLNGLEGELKRVEAYQDMLLSILKFFHDEELERTRLRPDSHVYALVPRYEGRSYDDQDARVVKAFLGKQSPSSYMHTAEGYVLEEDAIEALCANWQHLVGTHLFFSLDEGKALIKGDEDAMTLVLITPTQFHRMVARVAETQGLASEAQ